MGGHIGGSPEIFFVFVFVFVGGHIGESPDIIFMTHNLFHSSFCEIDPYLMRRGYKVENGSRNNQAKK